MNPPRLPSQPAPSSPPPDRPPVSRRSLWWGGSALGLALLHAGWSVPMAIGLGVLALVSGLVAAGGVFARGRPARQALGPAAGAMLGVLAILLGGVFFLENMMRRQEQFGQRRAQWDPEFGRSSTRSRAMSGPATFTPNLPIVVLHPEGRMVTKDDPLVMRAEFYDVRPDKPFDRARPDHAGLVSLNLRGMSSLRLPKPSYTLHTLDARTNQAKVGLLGMPEEEDWVLYAPFEDKTLVRDVLAYHLTRKMGHYAPRTRYVELFVDSPEGPLSMAQYEGVYVLVEKIKRGADRVKIAKLEPEQRSEPEISGGYIVKRDHRDRDGRRFNTSRGGPYFFVYPNERKVTAEQRAWLVKYFNGFESALYGPDFADPGEGYAKYLDVDSFIDAHWLIEMGKNVDGFRYSAFVTKDRGGKLKPEPPWDWNRSFGNANYYDGWEPTGWYWPNLRPNEISWYVRLKEDPAFVERAKARWAALRADVFDPKSIEAAIDGWVAELGDAPRRNFERWPIMGRQVTCNYYVGRSYEDEVRWLKSWITKRVTWMDGRVIGRKEAER